MTVNEGLLISADSHVIEPHDLWVTRVPKQFVDRAPHLVHEPTTDRMVCEGRELAPVGLMAGCLRTDDQIRLEGRWDEDVPSTAYDPVARAEAIEADGVGTEVLFPTLGMHLYPIVDQDLQWALFRAYNDWIAEFCAARPAHFKGLGMINHENVDAAVAEIDRCAQLGLSGIMIPLWTGEDNAYYLPQFDPVWRALIDHNFPVNMHTSTTRDPSKSWNQGTASTNWVLKTSHIQITLLDMIFYGLFDRFPQLKVVSAENDAGWAGNVIERADFWWRRNRSVYAGGKDVVCAREPSYYFHQNIGLTFMRDHTAIDAREVIGLESILWGSDFPHHVSTWPNSKAVIDEHFAGVADDVRDAVVSGNVRRIYGF